MYTKHVIHKDGIPIKIYVNADDSQAYIFPAFGRLFSVQSDEGALNFALTFMLAKNNVNNVISMASYQSSQEDTAIINIAA